MFPRRMTAAAASVIDSFHCDFTVNNFDIAITYSFAERSELHRPAGLCACGCGALAALEQQTRTVPAMKQISARMPTKAAA